MPFFCRIELLGWLRAQQHDRLITRFQTQKTGALLAYLAYHRHRSHPRAVLHELLWPEDDGTTGFHKLRKALTSLRRQLEPPGVPPGSVILADRSSVQLNPDAVTTDVAEFEAALAAARTGSRVPAGHERIQRLTEAVELYRGELLPGCYEEWIVPERHRLAEAYLQALAELSRQHEQAGELNRAVHFARRAVAADTLREEAHHELMRLLVAAGQPEAALRQYRELERVLRQELGAVPEAGSRGLVTVAESRRAPLRPPVIHSLSAPDRVSRLVEAPPAPLSPRAPAGTVTLLLIELPGPTVTPEPAGKQSAADPEERRLMLQHCCDRHGGSTIRVTRDSFTVAFQRASDAITAAGEIQGIAIPDPAAAAFGSETRPRMALHTGEVNSVEGEVSGPLLHHATRLLLAAHPGQILVSELTARLLREHLDPGLHLADRGLYRLRADAPPEHLFQVAGPGMPAIELPPPRAAVGHTAHLPLPMTRFFGREEELQRLRALLMAWSEGGRTPEGASSRLITLTGPGGSGKTRLALEAARSLWSSHHCAVYFVPLAGLTDPALVPERLREALHLPPIPQGDPLDQIVAALSQERTLLVLDNLEHLLPASLPPLLTLLNRTRELTLLVTSRHRLAVPGEQELFVGPLPVPAVAEGSEQRAESEPLPASRALRPALGPPPPALTALPSVQLFVDRAQAVKPDFQITTRNAAAIAALCRRLEGVPLALELAAARALVLTPQQMLARLEQRVEGLATSRRDAPPRHRSLWATIDWSYRLLSPPLQRFFARLSVFRGGWTAEAAADVCEEPAALDYLTQLRGYSLVQIEHHADQVRYQMLETLREYAAEQLGVDEANALSARHAEYYLALAEAERQDFEVPEVALLLDQLEQDHSNLLAALAWAIQNHQTVLALRLAIVLRPLWQVRGHLPVSRRRLEDVLSLPGGDAAPDLRAKVLEGAAALAYDLGDYDAAHTFLDESISIWTRLDNRAGLSGSLLVRGLSYVSEDRYDEARLQLERCQVLAQELGDRRTMAGALNALGGMALRRNEHAAARHYYHQSMVLRRELGDRRALAGSLNNLGVVSREMRDLQSADRYLAECEAIYRELGDRRGLNMVVNNLALLASDRGDYVRACAWETEALGLSREIGHHRWEAANLARLGAWTYLLGDEARAERYFLGSLELVQHLDHKGPTADYLEALAILAAREQPLRAARLFGAAEALHETWPSRRDIPRDQYDRQVELTRTTLGDAVFQAARAEGRSMPLQEAITYAMENTAPRPFRGPASTR